MAFCANCGAQLSAGANNCAACGKPAGQAAAGGAAVAPVPAQTGGLEQNIAGMLAYVTIIPAIVFLVLEPYNRNRFIRFHSFQCIFTFIALCIIHAVLWVIPFIGFIMSWMVSLAALALWIVCLIKAYGNQMWKIPFIGDIAEKQANS